MLRHYYPGLTLGEFADFTLWTLETYLDTLANILLQSNYSGFLLTQTVLNALRGKNTPAVEFETLLPDFANPFKQQDEKERAKARPYDPHSARLFDEAIRIGLVPEGIISILDLDLLKDAVKR